MDRRRRLQRSTVQAAADTAPVQRGSTSIPASDRKASPRSRSPENLSAPDPPAPPPASPIRHSSDGVRAGEAVRRVEWETGPASIQGTRAIFPRPAPPAAPASASATPSGDPVARRAGAVVPSTLFDLSTGTSSVQPATDQRRPATQDGSQAPPKLTGPVKPGHFPRIKPSPLSGVTAGRSGSAVRSCSPGTELESPAESRIHCPENSAPPFRICFFIIHVFVLTAGLMTIAGALGFWWVANHQKDARAIAVTALEYVETNKERLKPVTDFLEFRFELAATTKSQDRPR